MGVSSQGGSPESKNSPEAESKERKSRENKAERTKQRGVTDRKEKLKTAGSSLLEYGAGTVRCEDKRRHVLHSRWREVLTLALQSCLPSG